MSNKKEGGSLIYRIFKRYFIDAMSSMALGLFASLIIGLIISQLSKVSFLNWLAPFAEMVSAAGISRSAIQKHIERLKDAQRLRRVGPDKGGHWEVIEKA